MKYNILIADDVEMFRKLVRTSLKGIDHLNFYDASDGCQALECVYNEEIDLIMLDLFMPFKDGFTILKELKSMDEYKEIPVLVLSADDNIESIQKALELGAYDYFIKNVSIEQMKVVFPIKVKNALKSFEQYKSLLKMNNELNDEMQRIEYISFHDSLTGLYNRRFFDEELSRLEKDISRSIPLSIFSIDVDGLKKINDVLGHKAGDETLRIASEIISNSFRKIDIVARVGGDEFCIILPKTSKEMAAKRKFRIIKNINLYNMQEPAIPISMSIGVATCVESNGSIYETYQKADGNMYRQKKSKKNAIKEVGAIAGKRGSY